MPDLYMRTNWSLTVSTEELRLILKSLGGRLSGDEDIAAAKQLGDVLSRHRADQTKSRLEQNDVLLRNIS